MKESISVTALFQIVILFILIFTGIMCLTINNANAFGVKDEIINIIELSEGDFLENGNLNEEIVNLIASTSYRTTGNCDEGYIGYGKNGEPVGEKRASVCIKAVDATSGFDSYIDDLLGGSEFVASGETMPGTYYQVQVFFQLDLPIINQAYKVSTKGETKIIYKDAPKTNGPGIVNW